MTDLTLPAEVDGEIDNLAAAHSWEEAGTGAWIVDGSDIGGAFPSLDETGLNAFAASSTSGLTVTFSGGEAYGIGGWLARDRTTDVDVADDATTTVYLGVDIGAVLASGTAPADNDNITIGPESAFESPDPRVPIWTFTASSGAINEVEDRRTLQKPVRWDPISERVQLSGATINDSPEGATSIAPLEFNPEQGGSVFVSGLVDNPDIGASRAVAFSNGDTPSPPPAWFDVESGVGFVENGDRIATRLWALGQFNNYTFSESHDDLSNVSSDDHHSKYTDSDARSAAVASQLPGSVDIQSNLTIGGDAQGGNWTLNSDQDLTRLRFDGTFRLWANGQNNTLIFADQDSVEVRYPTNVTSDFTVQGDATLRKTEAWDEGDTDRVVYTDTDGGTLELVRE